MANAKATRQALRKQYIRAREEISPAEREMYSLRAAERIVSLPEFREASVVMLYRAVRGEMNLDALPERPEAAGKLFVYPRCVDREKMTAMIPTGWEPGAFGIPEPAEGSETVPPERIGLVICPGTAFDEMGGRLGMGAGYYDRFLPKCVNAVFLMAAFSAQCAEELPLDETDVRMDLIATEDGILRIRKGGAHAPDDPVLH